MNGNDLAKLWDTLFLDVSEKLSRNGADPVMSEIRLSTFEAFAKEIERQHSEVPVQRLLFMLNIYPNYRVDSRGPLGCITQALKVLDPEVAQKLSDGESPGKFIPIENGDRALIDTNEPISEAEEKAIRKALGEEPFDFMKTKSSLGLSRKDPDILDTLLAWAGRDPEDEANRDVHTEHCCSMHGCKYDDEGCPITTGRKVQTWSCYVCYEARTYK